MCWGWGWGYFTPMFCFQSRFSYRSSDLALNKVSKGCAMRVHHCICNCSYTDLLANFIVTVSNVSFPVTPDQLDSSAFIRCGQYQGYPSGIEKGVVTCSPGPVVGRFVFVSLPDDGQIRTLTLCECRVYAGRGEIGVQRRVIWPQRTHDAIMTQW